MYNTSGSIFLTMTTTGENRIIFLSQSIKKEIATNNT